MRLHTIIAPACCRLGSCRRLLHTVENYATGENRDHTSLAESDAARLLQLVGRSLPVLPVSGSGTLGAYARAGSHVRHVMR